MTQLGAMLTSFILEIPVVVTLLKFDKVPIYRSSFASFLATCITHPFAWNASLMINSQGWIWYVIGIELVVSLVETVILKYLTKIRWPTALIVSITANATSSIIGYFLIN